MASIFYNQGKLALVNGSLTWDSASFKAALVTASYAPNKDDVFASAFSGNELSGSGYTGGFGGSGRKSIVNAAFSVDTGTDRVYLDCDDLSWVGITAGIAKAAVLLHENTSDAASTLIAYLELATPIDTQGFDLRIKIPTGGWAFI